MGKHTEEKQIIAIMIRVYCQAHHQKGRLCSDCEELQTYANARLDRCPFVEKKPSCRKCPHHCYKPNMRKEIRAIMKYAGPRMMWSHPVMALKHILSELKN